ncbi:NAD(P)-dependent alcohol dehydrogenase [Actinosynnema sp. CA-248983]
MKAIVQDRYGAPDVLSLAEVPRPAAGDGEILVKVHAAAVNAYDWHVMRGDPYVARVLSPGVFGRSGPRKAVRGRDFAGTVTAVGAGVTRWKVGDEVFGDLGDEQGAFAEYARVPQDGVEAKPAGLTFVQAAALPLAGRTALAALDGVTPGTRVLVNGASGGVGTFAVQIAKALGAATTAVCSPRNADLARSLGADRVVDYTREDFTREQHDLVLDLVGNRSLAELRRAVTPTGSLVLSGGGVSTGAACSGRWPC